MAHPPEPKVCGGKWEGNGGLEVQWTGMGPALCSSRHLALHSRAQFWASCLSSAVAPGVGPADDPDPAEPCITVRPFLLDRL